MKLNLELADDTMVVSLNDLKDTMREMLGEIQTEQNMDDILNISEAADYMKVSVPTVRKLVQTKEIPHFQSGQVIRFNRMAILAWMARNDKNSTEVAE